ncbi:unnamed protein product [Macrosiphum euphorbiae]|uniref:DDE Tnp4 domain-containing protein n=1 Tax=Macrosiphum euphorbiae TaxID=13131 RepID=A0AAV0XVB1_9HEMI|nr:unnamed protein product [Macrosiphum euphorbiae]
MDEPKIIALMEYLSSSDSEEDIEIIEHILSKKKNIIPKINNYITDVVHAYTDPQFKGSFRMESDPTITSENHILSFIWFSANKCSLRDVSERFGIGLTTQFRINNRVMDFLVSISSKFINFNEGSVGLSQEFQKVSGMPGVIGCIDGSSIPIRTPAHKIKSTYTNRHDIPSITLQAICDYKKRFIDVFTGAPGKIHDARVFALSDISKELPSMCGTKYHIIGDGAYSIREWLLVPYKNYGNFTESQIIFNKTFCATRVLIENTFDKITKFIISCCVLHNMCINMNDEIELDNEIGPSTDPENDFIDSDFNQRKNGESKRDAIKNSLQYF